MLSKLIVLSIVSVLVSSSPEGKSGGGQQQGGPQGGQGPQGPQGGPGGPPPPPFLQNVTDDAKKSFFDIVKNENLTISEIETQSAAWAQTNGVSAIYTEFQANQTALQAQTKQNITTIISNLPSVQASLDQITSNKNQTPQQIGAAIDTLKQTYPAEVDALFDLQHPHGPGGPGGRGVPAGNSNESGEVETSTKKSGKKNNKKATTPKSK